MSHAVSRDERNVQKTAPATLQFPDRAESGQMVLAVSRGPAVRSPRSPSRSEPLAFAKLLSRVDPKAENGAGFEGVIIRPGRTVPESYLWPTEKFPKTPILLEFAGRQGICGCGRERDVLESLYTLWRYDLTRLKRPGGATLPEIYGFGWQAYSVRSIIAGAIKKEMGYQVESTKNAGGEQTYAIKA
jgi:hypothetical protein